MTVHYQDYYAVLGVPRTASAEEIRRAYRQLARKHHPDVDKSAGATQRFQQLAEAYEVLKDPATRQRYDTLGPDWKEGQPFTPPPGWGSAQRRRGPGPRPDLGGFSSFFESVFGGADFAGFDTVDEDLARRGQRARAAQERVARDVEAELAVPFATALRGGKRAFQIDDGSGVPREIEVRIPPASFTGTLLRLRGQGRPGGGRTDGDLILRLVVEPPAGFTAGAEEGELRGVLRIAPHQAVLGARVAFQGPDGAEGTLTVAPGTSSGRVLRLRGQGLPKSGEARGDLLLEIAIVVPERPNEAERRAYEELARALGPAEAPTRPASPPGE